MFLILCIVTLKNSVQSISGCQSCTHIQTMVAAHGCVHLLNVVCAASETIEAFPSGVVPAGTLSIRVEEDRRVVGVAAENQNPVGASFADCVCVQNVQILLVKFCGSWSAAQTLGSNFLVYSSLCRALSSSNVSCIFKSSPSFP